MFKKFVVSGIAMMAMAGFAAAQQPLITGIKNAAPFVTPTGNLARGELIAIYGSNLTNGVTLGSLPPGAPTTLSGTQVSIGGLPAPILFISPTQVNVQVPFEIPVGVPSVNVAVTSGASTSTPFLMGVVTSDLGMFSLQGGAPVSANTAVVNVSPGVAIVIMATGLGFITPAVASGTDPSFTTSNAIAIPSRSP